LKARNRKELLLKVISRGWIRVRKYRNYWLVTAHALTPAVQELLRNGAEKMLYGVNGPKERDRYMPVKVSTLEGESHCTIGDLADGTCPR
jgi:hypothetical protein